MNWNFVKRIPECIGASVLIVCTAVGVGSVFACAFSGQPGMIPLAGMFLGLFLTFDLWWIILGLSIWVTWFPPKNTGAWFLILVAAEIAGVIASWRFQVARPWDFYHEADGSVPGWEPVHMASLTTSISCVTAAISVIVAIGVFGGLQTRAPTDGGRGR